ncbi:MAG: hypothetical protein IKT30_06645 [Bacteroidaceae bacterium]|nr:hypothetical protein [Bacteroidaceae bacterium]
MMKKGDDTELRLSKEEKKMLQYIRHYPEWVNMVETLVDMRSAITYDADKVQTSPSPDGVLEVAMQIEFAQDRIDMVEKSLNQTYKTDGLINAMRDIWCYGRRESASKRFIYRSSKAFAQALLDNYGCIR